MKTIRLNEAQVRDIVRRSVKRVLKEGTTDQQMYNRWLDAIEMMGAEKFLDELYNCLNADEIEENLRWIDRNNELGLFNDEETEEEEGDDDKVREELMSMDPESACEYILQRSNTGNEIELNCGICFGMGIYAYKDTAEQYLPGRRLRPTQNPMFVGLNGSLLKLYLQNVYNEEGYIG